MPFQNFLLVVGLLQWTGSNYFIIILRKKEMKKKEFDQQSPERPSSQLVATRKDENKVRDKSLCVA